MKSAMIVCALVVFISVAVRAHPLLAQPAFFPMDPRIAVDPPYRQPPIPGSQCLLGCKPGDIIKKTDMKRVNSSLDDLANEGWQNRKCMVGFANVADKAMNNPRFYLKDGSIKTMPHYELPAGRTVLLLFTKTLYSLYGTKGVMSYDVVGADVKVALMWSVPKNINNPADIKYYSKVFPKTTPTNKDMYKLMAKEARAGDGVVRTDRWLEVSTEGVMYPSNKAKVILRVDTSPPTTPAPPTTTTTTPKPTTTTTRPTTKPTTNPTTRLTTKPTIKPTTKPTTSTIGY